jgi:peptidoglycan/xylan/chitin deacetylase (PgdA/CDA1 family)
VLVKIKGKPMFSPPWIPISRYIRRKSGSVFFRKMQAIRPAQPLISFTFDDFPRSALLAGGAILKRYGLSGTYYTAFGLIGEDSPSGQICLPDDVRKAFDDGHELGCHTYSHYDSWQTEPEVFEDSIIQNRIALSDLIPGVQFKSFSFPLSSPRPMAKRVAARYFLCCRAGGQTINLGRADLNQLSAYFLEKANGNIQAVADLIDKNKDAKGWIIFATHDICPHPSPYGCTPEFFGKVVRYAVESGALILPVARALEDIRGTNSSG